MLTILIVLLVLVRASQGQETAVFKAGVADVRVVVQVTEDGKLITDLKQTDFVVKDEGTPQPIAYFASEAEPLSLLLLLDISGSMRQHIEQLSETARDALRYLKRGDRVGIMTFGVTTNLHSEFSDNQAAVAKEIGTAADDVEKTGYGTAINPAVIEAAKLMAKDDTGARRSILIVTDNLGLNYKHNDHLTIGYLLNADTVLNAIVVGRGIRPGPPRPGDNPDYTPADVFRLAEATGGEAVTAERASASFATMIERIRNRYTIAYHVPDSAKTGDFRHITVALAPAAAALHPHAVLRSRLGYYVK